MYPGARITQSVIKENIQYHWSGIIERAGRVNNRTIYADAKSYFIEKLIRTYIQNELVKGEETSRRFQSIENPQGVSRKTVLRIALKDFRVSSWAGAIRAINPFLESTGHALAHISIEEFSNIGGESVDAYWKWRIGTYVIKGNFY